MAGDGGLWMVENSQLAARRRNQGRAETKINSQKSSNFNLNIPHTENLGISDDVRIRTRWNDKKKIVWSSILSFSRPNVLSGRFSSSQPLIPSSNRSWWYAYLFIEK